MPVLDERIPMQLGINRVNLAAAIKELTWQVEDYKKQVDVLQAKINDAMLGITRNEGAIWEIDRLNEFMNELAKDPQ